MIRFLFARPKRLIYALILLALLLLLSVQLAGRLSPTHPINQFLLPLSAPVQQLIDTATGTASNGWNRYIDLREVERENRELRHELRDARTALLHYREVRRELQELRNYFQYARDPRFTYQYARVVGYNLSNWFHTLTIDSGVEAGIQPDMAVVTDQGVVGRVVESSVGYARILSLADPNFAISLRSVRSRDPFIAIGSGLDRMELRYLSVRHQITDAELAITSGADGIFPAGLPVGNIYAQGRQSDLFARGVLQPLVDISRIEEVLVLIPEGTTPSPESLP